MEDVFNLDGILDASQIDDLGLFSDNEPEQEQPETPPQDNNGGDNENNNNDNKSKTTEVDPNELFEETPESVGSGEHQDSQEPSSEEGDDSPKNNSVYSSFARAFYEDDAFPDLDEDDIKSVTDADSFRAILDKQIDARLTAVQKRVKEALENNVEPTQIQSYEDTLKFLNDITDDKLSAESDEGEDLRKRLIFQDYLNKGFTRERAAREVKKSIDNATDVEDAKDALASNKEFYSKNYNDLLSNASKEQAKIREEQTKQAEALKSSIDNDNYLGDDIVLDRTTRKKVFETIAKPKHKDTETGRTYTDLEQYEREHKADYLKYVGTIFTITDGFKNFDRFVKGKVRKEMNKNIRDLESKLANTSRNSNGNLTFMSGSSPEDISPFSQGWKLNV